jgi:exonuclease SbcC
VGGYEKQLEAVTGQYRVLGRIADVANGKNPKNVTFQRFVLGALLDDVILRASERLSRLSKGRFILNRSQDLTRANAAGGLNIEVYDHYTSTTRPVANLSGGESFLASLALALGLAEVVQSYSGGTYLEAMFIDEGFGSLDADSLDEAVRILFSLQEQGRLVGIISHIDELKERIDARLEVKKSEFGSSLSFHVS